MNSNLFFKNDLLFSKLHLVSYSTYVVCNKAINGHQLGSNSDRNWQISTVGNLWSSTSLPKSPSVSSVPNFLLQKLEATWS